MPLTDERKRELLISQGYDPGKHDLGDDGTVYERAGNNVSPTITNTPTAPDTTKFDLNPQPDSPFTTFKKSAGASIIPTLLAGAGAGLASSQLNPLAHVAPPYSEILSGLIGMGVGSFAGSELQDSLGLVPEGLQESQAANPLSALAGGLSTMPLGGFSAGPQAFRNIGSAAGSLPKLLSGMSRTPAETQALINVGLGTGLGAALPAGEALAKGEVPDLKSVLTGAATGMAFNEPNVIGRRLFGFHPTVKAETGLPGIEDVAPVLNSQPEMPITGATIRPEDVGLLNRITGATWKEGKKGAVDLVPAGTGTASEAGAAETSARAMKEALDKGLPAVENPRIKQREIEISEAEKSRQDWEEARTQNEALKKAQTDSETARLKAENEQMAEQLRAGLAPKLDAAPLPPPKVTTELGTEIHPDYTGVTEHDNTINTLESPADLEARRLEGLKDRYSEKSALEEAPIGTEFTGGVVNKIKESNISPERTPDWRTKMGQFLQFKRGVKVNEAGDIINEATGQKVAGRTIKDKVGNVAIEISNTKGKLDTDFHEAAHAFIDSVRGTPLYTRFESVVSELPEFKAINEQRIKAGAEPWTPEEYIATEQGFEGLDRNLKLKGENPIKTWWKDFSSHVKTHFGKGGSASPEDYRRILQYKFQYDKPITQAGVTAPTVINNQDSSQLDADKALYSELDAKRQAMMQDGTAMKDGNFSPEFTKLWQDIENLKNKHDGMPPGQTSPKREIKLSEQSELSDPTIDKVTKLGEKAFDDSIEASSYDNELGAHNAGDLSNKFYKLRGILSGSKLDVRNSEKSQLENTNYKASFVPFLTSRFDKIAENLKSPTARMVTDNLNNFAAEQDILTGRIGNELIAAGKDFNEQEQQRVYRYAHQMSVNGDSNMTLTGREKKLFAARLSIIQDVRKLQNELGLKVKAGKEFRAGGIDPKGYIFSEIDPAVANTWAEKPNSAKSKEYDAAYIKHMTDHGISLQEATQALHEYKGAIGSNKPIDVEFGALRKAAGVGLPWELVDKNFNSAAIRYARRASRDLAYFKWIQNDPKMLKALDLRDQYGRLPTVEDVKDVENIAPNAAVKQAMRSVEGVSDNNINPTTMAYARAANNTIMGVGTAARNILNMPAFIASYVQVSQLPKIAQAISHMSESRVRAFKNNAVRAGFEDFDAAGYYLGNPNPTIRLLNRYSELARKYQGRNLSDRFEGEYYYSLGELLATDNIAKAKEGNKESKAFVKKFGTTVNKGADSLLTRKVTQDDVERVAKAFVDSARGTYGPSGLPSFALEGQLSPFFALSRFSIEKANTIWKDVVEPARKGIYGPAIRYILGSAGVGYAIEALNEELANKRGGEPTVSEVVESGTKEDMIAKAISTAQLASFAGIVSDGAQLVSNAARGKGLAYSNPVSFPLYTLVTDTFGRNISDAATAIKEGEDVFSVLGKLATVLSTQSVQTMRYLDAHVLHPDEAKRKEKFRDYNVWMQLTDRAQPDQAGKANEFKNLSAKEFKREDDLGKAVTMLPKLVESAVEKSKDKNGNLDPVKLSENFKSLKLNSYQIMPALEKDPRAFAEYYQHISDTQGADKAKNLLVDFMSQREVNKVKNSLVPNL